MSSEVIFQFIKNLNPNKAHGHDEFLWKCLSYLPPQYANWLLYKNCLASERLSDVWKKGKIVPVHKKRDKQLIKNHRSVSLLPLCEKLFEKFMVNSIFRFIDTRKIFSVHQSGFHPGDSCVHQLIGIVDDINNAFDANPSLEVRGVFLDICKTFDRVWH